VLEDPTRAEIHAAVEEIKRTSDAMRSQSGLDTTMLKVCAEEIATAALRGAARAAHDGKAAMATGVEPRHTEIEAALQAWHGGHGRDDIVRMRDALRAIQRFQYMRPIGPEQCKEANRLLVYLPAGYPGRWVTGTWFSEWKYDARYPDARNVWTMEGGYVIEPTHYVELPAIPARESVPPPE
jgi:hypothetical protein